MCVDVITVREAQAGDPVSAGHFELHVLVGVVRVVDDAVTGELFADKPRGGQRKCVRAAAPRELVDPLRLFGKGAALAEQEGKVIAIRGLRRGVGFPRTHELSAREGVAVIDVAGIPRHVTARCGVGDVPPDPRPGRVADDFIGFRPRAPVRRAEGVREVADIPLLLFGGRRSLRAALPATCRGGERLIRGSGRRRRPPRRTAR